MKGKLHINIYQIFVDAFCLLLTYAVAIFLSGAIFSPMPPAEYLWIPVLFGMVYIFTMFSCEMYHRSTFTYQDRTLKYVMKSCVLAVIFCLVMLPFTSKDIYAVYFHLIYILTAIVILSMDYLIVQELRQIRSSKWNKWAIFVGCNENIQEYIYYIKKTSFQVNVAGYVSLDNSESFPEKNLGTIQSLDTILDENVVDEVVFAVPCSLMEEIRPYVLMCKEKGLTVRLAVDFFETRDEKNSLHNVGTIPVFTYQSAYLTDFQSMIKRLMDIIGAVFGLCLTLLLSFIIVPLILIQEGGPVFRQKSYLSVNGRSFVLYIFNTGENGKRDSLTSRLLKRTGMANLPMFWNVLKGDMSLVGSLPIAEAEYDVLSHWRKKVTLKPGLTGTWRFADNTKLRGDYIAELNVRYLHKWSFVRDIWLIVKTILSILTTKPTSIRTSLLGCLEEQYGVNSVSSISGF